MSTRRSHRTMGKSPSLIGGRFLCAGYLCWMLLLVFTNSANAQVAPLRILPLGDSITFGLGAPGGYRAPLFDVLTAQGYQVDFVGTQTSNAAEGQSEREHEGHSGWQIDQILGISESVLAEIDDPDVVLLLIGTNDFSNNNDTQNAIHRLENLVRTLANLSPSSHIVLSNLTERAGPLNTQIQTQFNSLVPGLVDTLSGEGMAVHFIDLYSAVPLADMPDGLHPDLNGYTKMAAAWASHITAIFGPNGAYDMPPKVLRANAEFANNRVTVTFSKPVSDTASLEANYQLSGGASVSAADLDPVSLRDVTLTTDALDPATVYQLTVSGVSDRNDPPLSAALPDVVDLTPARGVFNNVLEAGDYDLVYSLEIPDQASYPITVAYDVDLREYQSDFGFDRVAYYLELRSGVGPVAFAWASMDPFTGNTDQLGVPSVGSDSFYQGAITNINVVSSVASVTNGSALTSGNLEFWSSNYDPSNSQSIANASDTAFDFGDNPTAGNYGSMQVHNAAANEVIFAFNRWGGYGGVADLGIGNRPGSSDIDWTFAQNANQYTVKRLQVLARTVQATAPPVLLGATAESDLGHVVLRFSKPLDDSSATDLGNYVLSDGLEVLGASLDPLDKLSVRLRTSIQQPGHRYTVAVSAVLGRGSDSSPVEQGTQAAFYGGGFGRLPLAEVEPGSEVTQLVQNGDFEDLSSGNSFDPTGWGERYGNAFYTMDSAPAIGGLGWSPGLGAARVHVDGGPGNGYGQFVSGLDPSTDYVISAYMAVPGDSQHTGNAVLDMNDIADEVQISIDMTDPNAAGGYFVFATFNTADTSTGFKLRIFQDEISGTSGWPYQPVGALWDNVAITRADQFRAPEPPNLPPGFSSDPIVLPEASEDLLYAATLDGLANDPEGDAMLFELVSGPEWLTLSDPVLGELSGTPSQADVGAHPFVVSVTDGNSDPVQGAGTLVVNNVNDAPQFTAAIIGGDATAGQSYSDSISGSATDEDGDSLTYSKAGGPSWLSISPEGDLSGVPATVDIGENVFTVVVDDGQGATDSAALTITVNDVAVVVSTVVAEESVRGLIEGNYSSTADSDDVYQTITEVSSGGKPSRRYSTLEHLWRIEANGADAELVVEAFKTVSSDGDDFQFSFSTDGINFTSAFVITDTEDTDTPRRMRVGPVSGVVTVKVEDTNRSQGSDSHFDTVFVDYIALESGGGPASNSPPGWLSDPIDGGEVTAGETFTGSLAGLVADPEGDPLVFAKVGGPEWLQVASDGSLFGVPATGDLGLNTFQVSAADGSNPPVASDLNISVLAGGPSTDYYVADIAMRLGVYKGNRYSAIATVLVTDDSGSPVSGAQVSVNWSGATAGVGTGETNAQGQVELESARVKGGGTFVVSIADVAAPVGNYDPGSNVETTDSISN